ncbi:hypothetical protein ACWEQL_18800 [Kitasatospora sp. NPDC004240]
MGHMREAIGNGRALLGWGVLHAAAGAAGALGGTPLLGFGDLVGPAWLGWPVAALGVAAAWAGAAAVRGRPWPRGPLWALAGLTAATAFSLLMDVITLVFGQGVDSWPRAGARALAAAGTLLLAAAARTAGHAGASGPDGGGAPAVPSAAPGVVQLAAVAGSLAFVPYAAMKTLWAFGGTFAGVSGAEVRAASERNGASGVWLALESWGLDPTALLAGLGVFLLWGLVRPWGQRFPRWTLPLGGRAVPRWLPLTPALLGAATLAPYGLLGVSYCALGTLGLVEVRTGDFPSPGDALLVSWVGIGAFAVYGVALAVAARSYWLRTRRRPAGWTPGPAAKG